MFGPLLVALHLGFLGSGVPAQAADEAPVELSIYGQEMDNATYALARERMREAQGEMDRQCSKLLLGAQGAYNQHKFDEARIELEHVNEFFPEKKHPCPFRADQMREAWGI